MLDMEIYTHDLPGVNELYAEWASGGRNEGFGFAVAVSRTVCGEVADALYDLHIMEFQGEGYARRQRLVKDWAYTVAAEFATKQRKRIKAYRLDWGRQAARDGLGLAMWRNLYGMGLRSRSEQFGITRWSYERVRDHVKDSAAALIANFASELDANNSANVD